MALDLKVTNLAEIAETGYEFEVKLPDGTPSEFFITVRGDQSPKVKAYAKRQFSQLQNQEKAAKRKGKEVELDYDDYEKMAVDNAVLRVVTWRGLENGGKEIAPTEENIRLVMQEQDWIRAQVLEEASIAANFI